MKNRLATSAVVLAITAGEAAAEQKITFQEQGLGQNVGVGLRDVAASGDVLVAGWTRGTTPAGLPPPGTVRVYRLTSGAWAEVDALGPSDSADWAFGEQVAIGGDVIAASTLAGGASVDVFRSDGTSWIAEQNLVPSTIVNDAGFGWALAVLGDRIVVGAPGDGAIFGERSGSVFVYRWNGSSWDEEQKLTASDSTELANFGSSVALAPGRIVVGADGDDEGTGAVYVFGWNGSSWDEEQKLVASDGEEHDVLGAEVATAGDVIVAAARWEEAVYVFRWNGSSWAEEQKITASDAAPGDGFGHRIAVEGNLIVTGARSDDNEGGVNAGATYVHRWNGTTWAEERKLVASDAQPALDALFGGHVALAGTRIAVGSAISIHAYLLTCEPSECFLDQPVAAKRVQMQRTASGERFLLTTKDPSLPLPLTPDSAPPQVGMTIELFSANEPSATLTVPSSGDWELVDKPTLLRYSFANASAPGGSTTISRVQHQASRIKTIRSLTIKGKGAGLALTGSQGEVAVRITMGGHRLCALFDAPTITIDETARFSAGNAEASALPDCSDASLP